MKVQTILYESGMAVIISLEEAIRRLSSYYAYPMDLLLRGIPVTTPHAEYYLITLKNSK